MSNLDLAGRELFLASLGELAADGGPTIILATHNTLEIGPFLTHALILAEGGAVMAAGPVDETLTSDTLSRAFGLPLKVEKISGRYLAFM
jgi:iron complex transport system ATP-binding protein